MVTLPEEGEPLEKGEKSFLGEGASLEKGHCCKAALAKAKAADEIPAGSSSSRPKPFINRREGAMVHGHSSQALQKALGYGTTEPAAALAKGKALGKGKGDKAAAKALAKGKGKGKKASAKALAKGKRGGKASAKALGKGKASAKALAKGQKRPLEREKLIVEVPATWSSQHDLICNKIMKALEKDSLSKAEALKMREELVAAYP
ncbi:unnamed protein product [Durusdinium trenchii]|uniref:Uncharacterized protein n=1 Tax=Durusdinium trenchii TaxID=1381693 RepID=A0ABP0Q3J1_9DINO